MIALSVILAIIAGIVWWIKNTFYFSKR
jgi:hypothetical protein